jgi:hypothetical protein
MTFLLLGLLFLKLRRLSNLGVCGPIQGFNIAIALQLINTLVYRYRDSLSYHISRIERLVLEALP